MKRIVLLAILLVGLFTLVSAQDTHSNQPCNNCDEQGNKHQEMSPMHMDKGPGMDCDMGCDEDMADLKLTDEQKDRITTIREANRKEMIALNADIDVLEIDLRANLRNAKFQDAIKTSDQISDKRKIIAQKRIQTMAAIYNVLTPDQQKIMKDRKPMPEMKGHKNCNHSQQQIMKPHRERKDKDE
jgi:Spy/CpxP family protein refolding chaperone